MGWEPPGTLLASLAQSVRHCPFPRALSRTHRLRLQALSDPAIRKRPSVVDWIGRDLAPIACGILEEMLDDRALQKSISGREIACMLTTPNEHPQLTAVDVRLRSTRGPIGLITLKNRSLSSIAELFLQNAADIAISIPSARRCSGWRASGGRSRKR